MNDVVSTFPLMRLPIDAIQNTFRCITYPQIFGISVLSKKTKHLVESLKLTTSTFRIIVAGSFRVVLIFADYSTLCFDFYRAQENEPPHEIGTSESIEIRSGRNTNVTWTSSLNVKQLIDHLQLVFHSSTTSLSFYSDCERFSVESIHRNVKNVKLINFSTGNHAYNRRALSLFQPASVDLEGDALVNECVSRDILIQNFDLIRAPNVQNTLDDLLMTNARFIHLSSDMFCRILSTKTTNQFLKLWAKGSNSRLERAFLRFLDNSPLEELFCGLNYTDAPRRRVRYFKTAGEEEPKRVTGGWDVWRVDGTQATINILKIRYSFYFQFFVWHDHCLVG